MQKSKIKKNNTKLLYIAAISIVLFAVLVNHFVSRSSSKNLVGPQTPEEVTEEINHNILLTLQNMGERDRMEYYFGTFLEQVESEAYEQAYELLYEEFRNTYFPTQEQFEEYVTRVFGEMTEIEYHNIERNGDLYVLWISLADAIHGKPGEKQEMKIVIQEQDYNDFVMSFSVI